MKRLAIFATLFFLCACGGGGGGTANVPAVVPTGAAPAAASAQVTLRINTSTLATASNARTPKFVSPSAVSLTIALASAPSTPLATVNIAAGSSNCTATAAGSVCTATFNAPVGADSFIVSTLDASKNVLSTATLATTVVANTTNSLSVTLGGVIATLQVILGSTSVLAGMPAQVPLTVVGLDAAGNVIIGPGNYSTAVTLTDSDASGVTHLSATQVAAPGTSVILQYNGGAMAGATITATAGSVTANASFAASGYNTTDLSITGTNSFVGAMAAGPDGNVWFTNGATIGFITPAGASTLYSNNVPASGMFGLTAGANGVLWYGSENGDIGTITTGGTVTPVASSTLFYGGTCNSGQKGDAFARRAPQGGLPPPALCSVVNWMILGPDLQTVWFTDDGGYIGTATAGGVVTEYDITQLPGWSGTTSEPGQISFGADGAIYVAEVGGLLDRITVGGSPPAPTGVTYLANPDECNGSYAMAIDSSNTIWDVDSCANLYSLPLGSSPSGFAGNFSAGNLSQALYVGGITNNNALGYMIATPGGVWGVDFSDNNVYRINTVIGTAPPQPAISSFSQFPGDSTDALVFGGDGNLWTAFETSNEVNEDVAKTAFGAPPIGSQTLIRTLPPASHTVARNAAALRQRHHRRSGR